MGENPLVKIGSIRPYEKHPAFYSCGSSLRVIRVKNLHFNTHKNGGMEIHHPALQKNALYITVIAI